jgi:hypothetical protein
MKLKSVFKTLSLALAIHASHSALAADTCDRTCLEGMVDRYLDAVIANNPKALPLAANTKFTEDGQPLALGDGLWNTMKAKGTYRLFVPDVTAGQVAFIGTIEEDNREPAKGTLALLALRLKISNQTITEIEQIVVRDEVAAKKIVDIGKPRPGLLATVPANARMSRQDLLITANKYFSGMEKNDGKGDYPFAEDCNRLENGSQTTNAPVPEGKTRADPKTSTNYSAQWSCMEQFKSGLLHFVNRIRDRRFVAVDEERGLVFAFGFFDHSGGASRTFTVPDGRTVTAGPVQPWTWEIAELFKVQDGKLHEIEAILKQGPYGMISGWSTWEQGMSSDLQDVTMK